MAGRVLQLPIIIGRVVLEKITFLFNVIFVPWRSNYEPIKSLLNAGDRLQDVQTSSWRDRKLAELTFVGITCALITGAVVQALTWPQAQTPSQLTFGLWYGSLVFSLAAICLAMQQSVALSRLSSYNDYALRIRALLGQKILSEDSDRGETWVPSKLQLYVWQTPIMLLNFGILVFVVGLGIMIFENRNRANDIGQALMGVDGNALAILSFVSAFAALNYIFSTVVLYHRIYGIST